MHRATEQSGLRLDCTHTRLKIDIRVILLSLSACSLSLEGDRSHEDTDVLVMKHTKHNKAEYIDTDHRFDERVKP